MARRVVLHIGAMKSGTTYLQGALYKNKGLLAERGFLVPGTRWRHQIEAVLDVKGRSKHPQGDSVAGAWDRLVAEVDEWDGTALISVELLAPVGQGTVDRVASSFSGVTPEIVLSLRDINRQIPSMWQELVQNGSDWTWSEFLSSVKKSRPGAAERHRTKPGKRFWSEQDMVSIARRWAQAGPLHLVTVPPPGSPPLLLLERFGAAMGFDPEGLKSAPPRNTSLGTATVEVLRGLNAELNDRGLAYPAAMGLRKHTLGKHLMPKLTIDDPRIGLAAPRWTRAFTRDQDAQLRGLDATVHGDLGDLAPVDVSGIDPREVTHDQVRDAAVASYAALRSDLNKKLADPTIPDEVIDPGAGRKASARAVSALAGLVEWSVRREELVRT
ncbi:hypothetical protein [Nocardioides albertanoniae]|uniref:hypothetical protein n=1 Tax=Nocardioides albertanoniae TaxID=1175486 RepID=UPI00147693FC|nr:hypothetical protein [Nocardioides albertanoniae]